MKPTQHITRARRIEQIADLAANAQTDPLARRQLANAALMHGLAYSDRIDTITLVVIERITELSRDALGELDYATRQEARRRVSEALGPSEAF